MMTSQGMIAHETASAQAFERLTQRLGLSHSRSTRPKILAIMDDIQVSSTSTSSTLIISAFLELNTYSHRPHMPEFHLSACPSLLEELMSQEF